MVRRSNSLHSAFVIVSHLLRFGGKPAGLLYGAKQEEGAVIPEHTETKSFSSFCRQQMVERVKDVQHGRPAQEEERHVI